MEETYAVFKRIRIIMKMVGLFLVVPLMQILIAQWFELIPVFKSYDVREDILNGQLLNIISAVFALPLFFSLVRAVAIYDELLLNKFSDSTPNTIGGSLSLLFHSIPFWIRCAAYVVVYWILPFRWFYVSWERLLPIEEYRLQLNIVLLPVLFLLNLLAHLSAMRVWRREKKAGALWKRLLILFLDYGIGGLLLRYAIPVFISLVPLIRHLPIVEIIVAIVALLLILSAYRWLRAVRIRSQFFKRLRKLRADGLVISDVVHPYRSLISPSTGESFHVQMDGKHYSCKLISSIRKNVPISFDENGTATFHYSIKIFHIEVFQYQKKYECSYDGDMDGQRILILSPAPKRILTYEGEKAIELDTGDMVGDYKLYTGSAFLNAIERQTLGR